MTLTGSVKEATASARTEVVFPSDFVWGAATAAYQVEGAVRRGRPRREHLGPLQRHAREGRERRHRRGRLRLVPPACRGHAARPRARSRRVPLLHLVAASPSGRARAREHGRARLLRPGAGRDPRRAASSRTSRSTTGISRKCSRSRRLAGSGDGRGVRGVRRGGRVPARRPRRRTGSRRTSRGSCRGSGTASGSTRRVGTSEVDALAAAHHVLLAHGRAAQVIRREAPRARVGVTLDLYPMYPLTDAAADVEAARFLDGSRNRWFLEPVLGLGYPTDMLEHYASILPRIEDGDWTRSPRHSTSSASTTTRRNVVRAGSDPAAPVVVDVPEGVERTEMGWEVYPDGLKRPARPPAPRLRAPAALHHRERRRLSRRPAQRARARPETDLLPRAAPRRSPGGDRGRRPGARATSSGRCSTTSSGRSASRSASASSTSTSRRSSACPRRATPGTATSSRRSAPVRP